MTSNGLNDRLSEIYQNNETVDTGCQPFFRELMAVAGCDLPSISQDSFNKTTVTKKMLSSHIHRLNNIRMEKTKLFLDLYDLACELFRENDMLRHEASELKSTTIEAQEKVISVQNELLICKDKQLERVGSVVENAVQHSVKTEMKSYSDALSQSAQIKAPEMKCLKKAVEQVIKEDDCSRNFLVFGLAEETEEDTPKMVNGLLECVGVKPKHESVRIGVQRQSGTDQPSKPRPIKVSVSSSAHVIQILRAARKLKNSEHYQHVFIAPDRTVEERKCRRELVALLNQKRQEETDKRHFIRNGKVVSLP